MKSFSYESMGTRWEITVWDEISVERLKDLEEEIFLMSDTFDRTYSRFIKTSLVWQIAADAGKYEVPEDFMNMLKHYEDLYEATERKLNPLIGFTISDLGYDDRYSLVPKEEIRKTPDFKETVKVIDETHIETKEPVLFDFGALGKGYFVDRIADYLKKEGFTHFLVNGSGDIYYAGPDTMKVGLEHPFDAKKVIGTIDMKEGAMCASGTNRRKWDKYHHVIDPHSNESTEHIVATWVIAKTAAEADALASCLFFVAPENLSSYQFEYCIMNERSQIKNSAGFDAEFF